VYGVINCTLRFARHLYILGYCFKILISHDLYFAGHVCRFGKGIMSRSTSRRVKGAIYYLADAYVWLLTHSYEKRNITSNEMTQAASLSCSEIEHLRILGIQPKSR
jgi:hypothetical protein